MALQAGARGYVISGSPLFLEPTRQAEQGYQRPSRELRRLVVAPEQRARLGGLRQRLDAYVREWHLPLIELVGQDRKRAAALVSSGEGRRRMAAFRALLAEFVATEGEIDARVTARAEGSTARAQHVAGAGMVVALLLVLFALAYVWRAVIAPVRELAGTARAVAAGDLAARAPQHGVGEVAALISGFNLMVEALEEARREHNARTDRLEALFASSSSAIVAVDRTDSEGVAIVSGWSAAAERMFGIAGQDAVGAPLALLDGISEELSALVGRAMLGERQDDVQVVCRSGAGIGVATSVAA